MTDPKQLVQIVLPNKRMYRERQEDRVALTVGPGLVTVPRWVANEWGFQVPEPEPKPDPVVEEVVEEEPETEPEPEPTPTEAAPKPKRKTKKAT